MKSRVLRRALTALVGGCLLLPAAAAAHTGQHGSNDGHLLGPGAWGNIELVGKLGVSGAEDDLIADVAAFGNYAYLANWGEADCAGPEVGGQSTPDSGAWVVDISNPAAPVEKAFIAMPQDTRPGEGMQVVPISTSKFTGDLLVMNAEACGKNYKGGFMLYDVSTPLEPVKLKEGFGERTGSDAHQTHSAFAWQAPGSRSAYLVSQDSEDLSDVDIYDITNPRRPRMVSELDLNTFDVAQPGLNLADSNLHDMTVKCFPGEPAGHPYAGRCIMLASYWDGGYVLLDVTDPARPGFVDDTEYAAVDPELADPANTAVPAESRTLTPEGNGHQAEFTADDRFFVATDEDFSPYRAFVTTDDGGDYPAGEFGWTVPIGESIGTLNGPTVFGGYGCPADRGGIPAASTLSLADGEEAVLVLQRGPVGDPSQSQGACFFSEKVETAQLLGYDAVVIANHHEGALGGEGPDSYFCGGQGHAFDIQISALCIGHKAMHGLFDDPDATDDYTYPEPTPAIGVVGDRISVETRFDGWGYVHLFDAGTLRDLDTYAIPEAMDPAYASGYGDLSVHEVATDPEDPSLAYLAYYAGGLRAVQVQCADPSDSSTCRLVEVGGYLDPAGNDFWGVEVIPDPRDPDEVLILASDRDLGLFLFRER